MIQRFRISYRDGGYRVSIPNYDGGEVVRAEHYDRETTKLLDALREITSLHRSTRQTPAELARALERASAVAKNALASWE